MFFIIGVLLRKTPIKGSTEHNVMVDDTDKLKIKHLNDQNVMGKYVVFYSGQIVKCINTLYCGRIIKWMNSNTITKLKKSSMNT